MAKIRLLQVGLGGWGRDWMKVVRAEDQVQMVGYVDSQPAALQMACQSGADNTLCFNTLEQALEVAQPDAVLVTTGAVTHAPVALAALEAGLPVLVEKPFAPSIAEALAVVRAAQRQHLPLMVSQNYRFHPAPRVVAGLLRQGQWGEVGYVEVDFRRDNARVLPAPTAHHHLFQPLLMDMAIHHFDLMRFVLGREPVRIHCQGFNPPWSPFRDPASALVTIEFEGGVVASYRGSWASSGQVTPWAGEWRMDVAGGEVRWTSRDDPPPDRVQFRSLGKRPRTLPLPALPKLDRAGSLAAFIQAILSDQEPESSGRDNLGSLALSLAAIQSAQEGRAVQLSEILAG